MFNRPGEAGAVLKTKSLKIFLQILSGGSVINGAYPTLFPNTLGILSCVYFSTHVWDLPHMCGIFHTPVGFSTYVWDFPHTCGIFHMFTDRTYHVEKTTQVGHLPHLSCLFQIHSAFSYMVIYF